MMLSNLIVIQYKGGRCGEFLSGYLSQHEGCFPLSYDYDPVVNAYYVKDPIRQALENIHNPQQISKFLSSNLKVITSTYSSGSNQNIAVEAFRKFKKTLLDNSAQVIINHSKQHNLFFDCLCMVKHWFKIMPSGKKRWQDEFGSISSKDFLQITGFNQTGESRLNKLLIASGVKTLDIDQLFFEKNYQIWSDLLESLGIKPLLNFEKIFSDYHDMNIALAKQYDIPLDRDTDNKWFINWVEKHA